MSSNRRSTVIGYVLAAGLLVGLFTSVKSAKAFFPLTPESGYHSECVKEGCSSEEVRELHDGYKSECFGEGWCSNEEVAELVIPTVGYTVYSDSIVPYMETMLNHFCRVKRKALLHDNIWSGASAGVAGNSAARCSF